MKNVKRKTVILVAMVALLLGTTTIVYAQRYANVGRTTWNTTNTFTNTRGRARTRVTSASATEHVVAIGARATIPSVDDSGWSNRPSANNGATNTNSPNLMTNAATIAQVYSGHASRGNRNNNVLLRGHFRYRTRANRTSGNWRTLSTLDRRLTR